ncbi:MAG: hypothetical protein H7839_01630 [Magnetococcus sp. YQC-5]
MLSRILIFLLVAAVIGYFVLKKLNIQISLTPLGRNALVMAIQQIVRIMLRRIGL